MPRLTGDADAHDMAKWEPFIPMHVKDSEWWVNARLQKLAIPLGPVWEGAEAGMWQDIEPT